MAARAASVWSRPHLVPAEEEVVVTRPLAACVQPRGAGRAVVPLEVKGSACRGLPEPSPRAPACLGRNNLPTHFQTLREEGLGENIFNTRKLGATLLIFNIRKQAQKDEVRGTKVRELLFRWHQHPYTSCQRLYKH